MLLICDTKINNKIINKSTSTTDINLTQARDTKLQTKDKADRRVHMFIYENMSRGFRPVLTHTELFSNRRWQTALNFGFRKQRFSFFNVAKIACRHWAELHFWFRLCKITCSYDAIQIAKTRFRRLAYAGAQLIAQLICAFLF